jgi:hypothetical protein
MAAGWFKNSTFVGSGPTSVANKNSDMSAADASALTWFNPLAVATSLPPAGNVYGAFVSTENSATVGVINEPTDGDINCSETAWLKTALTLWGYESGPQLLCDLGFTRDVNPGNCLGGSASDTNNFRAPDNPAGKLDNWWTSKLGGSSRGLDSIGPGAYRLLLDSFTTGCHASPASSTDTAYYTIRVFDDGAKVSRDQKYTITTRDYSTSTQVRLYQDTTQYCKQIAEQIDSADDAAVNAYKDWLKEGGTNDSSTSQDSKCVVDARADGCSPAASSCNIPSLGWLLCPMLNTGAALADGAYGFLSQNFLSTDASLVNTDPNAVNSDGTKIGTGAYTAWQIMRSIGNIAFIIVFLIIIFSQLSNIGVTNYGLKKLLPRLVIAAVLVNVSFLICQLAVDLSNILGYSLKDLLQGVATQVTSAGSADTTSEELRRWRGSMSLRSWWPSSGRW